MQPGEPPPGSGYAELRSHHQLEQKVAEGEEEYEQIADAREPVTLTGSDEDIIAAFERTVRDNPLNVARDYDGFSENGHGLDEGLASFIDRNQRWMTSAQKSSIRYAFEKANALGQGARGNREGLVQGPHGPDSALNDAVKLRKSLRSHILPLMKTIMQQKSQGQHAFGGVDAVPGPHLTGAQQGSAAHVGADHAARVQAQKRQVKQKINEELGSSSEWNEYKEANRQMGLPGPADAATELNFYATQMRYLSRQRQELIRYNNDIQGALDPDISNISDAIEKARAAHTRLITQRDGHGVAAALQRNMGRRERLDVGEKRSGALVDTSEDVEDPHIPPGSRPGWILNPSGKWVPAPPPRAPAVPALKPAAPLALEWKWRGAPPDPSKVPRQPRGIPLPKQDVRGIHEEMLANLDREARGRGFPSDWQDEQGGDLEELAQQATKRERTPEPEPEQDPAAAFGWGHVYAVEMNDAERQQIHQQLIREGFTHTSDPRYWDSLQAIVEERMGVAPGALQSGARAAPTPARMRVPMPTAARAGGAGGEDDEKQSEVPATAQVIPSQDANEVYAIRRQDVDYQATFLNVRSFMEANGLPWKSILPSYIADRAREREGRQWRGKSFEEALNSAIVRGGGTGAGPKTIHNMNEKVAELLIGKGGPGGRPNRILSEMYAYWKRARGAQDPTFKQLIIYRKPARRPKRWKADSAAEERRDEFLDRYVSHQSQALGSEQNRSLPWVRPLARLLAPSGLEPADFNETVPPPDRDKSDEAGQAGYWRKVLIQMGVPEDTLPEERGDPNSYSKAETTRIWQELQTYVDPILQDSDSTDFIDAMNQRLMGRPPSMSSAVRSRSPRASVLDPNRPRMPRPIFRRTAAADTGRATTAPRYGGNQTGVPGAELKLR